MTLLPTDSNNHPIPAIGFKDGAAHAISSSASPARNSTAFDADTKIISLYATEDIFIAFGDETVTATTNDHFFPKGFYYDLSIGGGTSRQYSHIAILRVSADGSVFISEKG